MSENPNTIPNKATVNFFAVLILLTAWGFIVWGGSILMLWIQKVACK